VKFIATRVQKDGEIYEQTRNRVSHLILAHVKEGKLIRRADEKFVLHHLAQWAKKRWAGAFDDLPTVALPLEARFKIDSSFDNFPETVNACHIELKKAHLRIIELEKDNAALKHNSDKYISWCKANSKNPKKQSR
jgi:hypothetical protein